MKFGQMCDENEEVRERAKEIGIVDIDAIIAFGKELGLDFNLDDMVALAEETGFKKDELSEEQQAMLAGGVVTTTLLGAAAVGAVVAFIGAGAGTGFAVGAAGFASLASKHWR